METKSMEKMDWIRERLEKLDNVKRLITNMDPLTQTFEKTMSHVKDTYPMSNPNLQLSLRKGMLD
jgi:hypothetical protein